MVHSQSHFELGHFQVKWDDDTTSQTTSKNWHNNLLHWILNGKRFPDKTKAFNIPCRLKRKTTLLASEASLKVVGAKATLSKLRNGHVIYRKLLAFESLCGNPRTGGVFGKGEFCRKLIASKKWLLRNCLKSLNAFLWRLFHSDSIVWYSTVECGE